MKNITAITILFLFTMCKSKHSPEQDFEGDFKGNLKEVTIKSNLAVSDNELKGIFIMNGQSSKISGTIKGHAVEGIIIDGETATKYEYTGSIEGDELRLSVTFPELNNRVIEMVLQREGGANAKKNKPTEKGGDINTDMVGLWKHSEILGGGGESMTNETMLEFMEDGTFSTWPGRSSGPGFYRDEDKSKATTGKWYTDGKTLHLVDPLTKEDATTNYSVSESGLLLTGDSGKKVFERIR